MRTKWCRLSDAELQALFLKAQAGDKVALAEALNVLEPLLRTLCYPLRVRVRRTMEVADLHQEARLAAIIAIREYNPAFGVPAGAFVTLCVKRALRLRLDQEDRRDGWALSLDAPTGDDDRDLTESIVEAMVYEHDEPDPEVAELLERVPPKSAGGRTLWRFIQSHNLNDKLPDDNTLVALVEAGKSLDELAAMFGVTRRSVQGRLHRLRASGVHAPHIRRDAKAQMVLAFIREHPHMKVKDAARLLGVGKTLVVKVRKMLREGA